MTQVQAREVEEIEELSSSDRCDHGDCHEHDDSATQWLGGITEFEQYRAIVDWASRSSDATELIPLPKEFRQHTLHPFR
jgi:hypothetical protein